MNSTKEQSYLNHEPWKYTKIDYFKDYNFNYTPNTNNSINQKCKKNEILLYNGEFLKAGEIIHDNKIIIYNDVWNARLIICCQRYLTFLCNIQYNIHSTI